ncbi:MAG: GNAT family N-acetyltransferase [Desulfosalsimonadaceae bacterium]
MSVYNLDRFFSPESIAVFGASEQRGSVGYAVMENLIEGGFAGTIYPINPKYKKVFGRKAVSRISKIDDPVDLAVIATPMRTVTGIVAQCIRKEVNAAVIMSAGGKEVGEEGQQIEADIEELARNGGLRIMGPNCLGIACPRINLNATFAAHMPLKGNMAFVSQSGAICTAILGISLQEQIGFSHFISIGSMIDVDFGDLIDYLGNDPDVASILLYVENITHPRKFMSAARSVSRVKPIVLLKAGKSSAGAVAAASHTGAMAGEDAVYDAAFKRAGIVRVKSIGELFECAELVAKQPRPKGNRLAIITNSGGGGVMAADALSEYGVSPAKLSGKTIKKLNDALPPYWSRNNPIDILGDASPRRYGETITICMEAEETDGILVILTPQAMTAAEDVADVVAGIVKKQRLSVFTAFSGGIDVIAAHNILNKAGVPTYDTPEQAIRAFMHLFSYERNLQLLQEIPPRLSHELLFDPDWAGKIICSNIDENGRFLTEIESKQLLEAYGLPVVPTRMAESADEAVRIAGEFGYPVVLKVYSPDISHKSDAGGVWLDLCNAGAVHDAFDRIMESARRYNPDASIAGVTVEPMISLPDLEILLGAKKDPNFGPTIMFGTGGVLAEIVKDRAIALPPLNRLLARFLIEDTRISKLLKGYRHIAPVDTESIEEIIIRTSQLVTDFPQIEEIDMNPVLIKDGAVHVADARIRVKYTDVEPTRHLVISPYPKEYESFETTREGEQLWVRPIKPEDAPLLEQLFENLSRESIHYRFFTSIKHLPKTMLARFTQVDYDRHIALVAIRSEKDRENMLGVCRIITDPDGNQGEFSIMVGDPWQGKGIGSVLLKKCLQIARSMQIKSVRGYVLSENQSMIKLGQKVGFQSAVVPGSGETELRMDLTPPD